MTLGLDEAGMQKEIEGLRRDCHRADVACTCDIDEEQCDFCRVLYGRFHHGMKQDPKTGEWHYIDRE